LAVPFTPNTASSFARHLARIAKAEHRILGGAGGAFCRTDFAASSAAFTPLAEPGDGPRRDVHEEDPRIVVKEMFYMKGRDLVPFSSAASSGMTSSSKSTSTHHHRIDACVSPG